MFTVFLFTLLCDALLKLPLALLSYISMKLLKQFVSPLTDYLLRKWTKFLSRLSWYRLASRKLAKAA